MCVTPTTIRLLQMRRTPIKKKYSKLSLNTNEYSEILTPFSALDAVDRNVLNIAKPNRSPSKAVAGTHWSHSRPLCSDGQPGSGRRTAWAINVLRRRALYTRTQQNPAIEHRKSAALTRATCVGRMWYQRTKAGR